ncbi:MAG: hypothetical protein SWQ30_08745 [Thermodesulfobacteriota bacterium]|nr:hypothetical protein [Thermodesulfobacteriota bacterium]
MEHRTDNTDNVCANVGERFAHDDGPASLHCHQNSTPVNREREQTSCRVKGNLEVAACQEQAQGIEQMDRAAAQINRVTQDTAASAEESASVSSGMKAPAIQMQGFVDRRVVLVRGKNNMDIAGRGTRQR